MLFDTLLKKRRLDGYDNVDIQEENQNSQVIQSLGFLKEVAKTLYKPMFIKRLIYSIILYVAPVFFEFMLALIIATLKINFKEIDTVLTLTSSISMFGVLFFFYNFTWYYSKTNMYRNNYINIKDNIIEYYCEERTGFMGGRVRKYLYKIRNITSVNQDNRSIIIKGTIIKLFLDSRHGYYEIESSLKVPKVFNNIDIFFELAESRVSN